MPIGLIVGLALLVPHIQEKVDPDPRIHAVAPYNAKLNRMAYCESTDRWNLDTGNGDYGGLQFSLSTWYAAGGKGYPNQNSELEQKYRAVIWHNTIGTWVTSAGWPVCGYR